MQNKHQDILSKTIALLLAVQLLLIGLQATIHISHGNSTLETFIWMIQKYIPVLVRIRSLKNKQNNTRRISSTGESLKNSPMRSPNSD